MKSRLIATAAVLVAVCSAAIVTSGCSQNPPAPTVNGAAIEASAAIEAEKAAIKGVDTTLTVSQLASRLQAAGLKATMPGAEKGGLFLPAVFEPIIADGLFLQTYRFKSKGEAHGAASTVSTDGAVLGSTPDQLINVHWTGQTAFFRSGDLVVIFVSQKPAKTHLVRDTHVYKALESIIGTPFAGTFLDSPGATSTATPQ